MALKIVKYVDRKKQHRWSIRSRNGKIIADGAEAYTSPAMRDKGLAALITAISHGDFKTVDETVAPKKVVKKVRSENKPPLETVAILKKEAGKKPAPKEVKKPKKVKVPAKAPVVQATNTLQ